MIRFSILLSLLLLTYTGVFTTTVRAQKSEVTEKEATELKTSVGYPVRILQTKIAGSLLVAKPYTDRSVPAMVRIIESFPHGTDFRYDIEFRGFEPGRFNIIDYLQREDESDLATAPLWVTVEPILGADKVHPIPLPQNESQFRSYYTPILFVSGVVWIAGLLAILFYGRGTLKKATIVAKTITPAEKMRPLIDAAIAGNLTTAKQAELERILSEFWSAKLNLGHLPADQLRSTLREHPEATKMLEQIDFWLHRPDGESAQPVDINALLRPYQGQNTTNTSE